MTTTTTAIATANFFTAGSIAAAGPQLEGSSPRSEASKVSRLSNSWPGLVSRLLASVSSTPGYDAIYFYHSYQRCRCEYAWPHPLKLTCVAPHLSCLILSRAPCHPADPWSFAWALGSLLSVRNAVDPVLSCGSCHAGHHGIAHEALGEGPDARRSCERPRTSTTHPGFFDDASRLLLHSACRPGAPT